MDKEILMCECSSMEHMIVFLKDDDTLNNKAVFAEVHLAKRPFWWRLKYGVLYILGRQCGYGAFEEVVIDKYNYQPFKNVVQFIEGK